MRSLSQTLAELITLAEAVLRSPQTHVRPPLCFAELSREVSHAHALPAESVRATRAGVVMITALDGFFANRQGGDPAWLMLAGATLPLLRREAFQALVDEREARAQ